MIVYLDWNVMESVIVGERAGLAGILGEAQTANRLVVPFSTHHLSDIVRPIDDDSSDELREKVDSLLRSLGDVTRDCYLGADAEGNLYLESLKPWDALVALSRRIETSTSELQAQGTSLRSVLLRLFQEASTTIQVDDLVARLNLTNLTDLTEMANIWHERNRRISKSIDHLGFGPGHLNNEPSEQVVEVVTQRIRGLGLDPEQIHQVMRAHGYPDSDFAKRLWLIQGYQRDRGGKSLDNQVADLGHLQMGLQCDVFVTDDRKLRMRAKAIDTEISLVFDSVEAEASLPVLLRGA